MKLTATLDNLAALSRLDPERLLARLRADLERELQAAAASEASRDALGRALTRIQVRRVRR